MSERVCKNCGKTEEVHPWLHGSLVCVKTFFEPNQEPEPMKAKPGMRYQHSQYGSALRFGTPDGQLRWCGPNNMVAVDVIPMSPGWEEVPE